MTVIAIYAPFQLSADQVASALPDDVVIGIPSAGALSQAAEAEVGLGGNKRDSVRGLLAAAPKLRWYHTESAGVDSLLAEFKQRAIALTNNRGAYDVPIAEYVLGVIFAASLGLPRYLEQQRRGQWIRHLRGPVRGSTLLIYGVGSIGGEVARLASAFGMRVLGVRRSGSPVEGVERMVRPEGLGDVVGEADHLLIAVPLTPDTRGAVSREVISRMKRSAWVINVARGEILDESALADALRRRAIGGVALDVFGHEPLPPESPFWGLENAIVTPHIAGMSTYLRERTMAAFVENLQRFKAGLPLRNQVDIERGY